MARIILFGSAVIGVLLVTLAYAVWSGQYEAAQPSPSPSTSGSIEPGASPSAVAPASASAAESASVEAEPSAVASGPTAMVMIANLSFGSDLRVAAGTTVTFMNGDDFAHTATQGSDGVAAPDALFDLQLPGGASDSYTFTQPGTYQVTCTLHAQMKMTITVQ